MAADPARGCEVMNDNGSKTPAEGRRNWVIANSRLEKILKDNGYA